MKLVSFTTIIAPEKLCDYLLNPSHGEGKSKARFLNEMGYDQANWQLLEADLRAQHLPIDVIPGKQSLFGTKYEIVAPLLGPNGQKRWIRSVWMIRRRESVVRFVTLIPEPKQ